MHILLTDETNKQPSDRVKFFIYGGILFPANVLSQLDARIGQIRKELGYLPTDELKFDTRSRPEQVSIENSTIAKQRVVAACKEFGVKFIVQIILHDIIKTQPPEQVVFWAADYVIGRFHQYIAKVSDDGIVVIDNVPEGNQYQYLTRKFQVGLEVQGRNFEIPRIKMFASTCVGASHANSAMDIVLGTFRFVLNNPTHDVSREMMQNLMGLIWHTRIGEDVYAIDRGLIFRPKLEDIRAPRYKKEYEQVVANINELIKEDEPVTPDSELDEDVPF